MIFSSDARCENLSTVCSLRLFNFYLTRSISVSVYFKEEEEGGNRSGWKEETGREGHKGKERNGAMKWTKRTKKKNLFTNFQLFK